MTHSFTRLVALTGTFAVAIAPNVFAGTPKRASSPIVITRPAIPDGSNISRAPYPAARMHNDVTPANGEAVDLDMAPNTPSTTPAPYAPPLPVVAILQPERDPGLMPTGQPTQGASFALDPQRTHPVIVNTTYESRENLVDNVRIRMRQAQTAVAEYRRTQGTMSEAGRDQFRAASEELRSLEKQLDRSLRAADRASAGEWEAARAQLAADFQAYAAALARLDASAGVTPATL